MPPTIALGNTWTYTQNKAKKQNKKPKTEQNEIKLQEWEFYVTKELIENPAPSIPRISPRRFGYGFYLGTGASFPVGSIADYWAPAWQINVGFDLAYANTHLLCDFSAGTARTRQEITVSNGANKDTWLRNGHNTYTSISLGIGQQLISTKYFALCLMSGVYGRDTPIKQKFKKGETKERHCPTRILMDGRNLFRLPVLHDNILSSFILARSS